MIGKHLGNLWQILLDFVLAIFTNDCTHSNHSSEKIAYFGEMLNFGSVQKCANLVDLILKNIAKLIFHCKSWPRYSREKSLGPQKNSSQVFANLPNLSKIRPPLGGQLSLGSLGGGKQSARRPQAAANSGDLR